jgi:hypothetical protein
VSTPWLGALSAAAGAAVASVWADGVATGAVVVEAGDAVAAAAAGRATNGISRGSIGAASGTGSGVAAALAVVSAAWEDGAAGGSVASLFVSAGEATGLATGGAGSLVVSTGAVGVLVRAEVLGLAAVVGGCAGPAAGLSAAERLAIRVVLIAWLAAAPDGLGLAMACAGAAGGAVAADACVTWTPANGRFVACGAASGPATRCAGGGAAAVAAVDVEAAAAGIEFAEFAGAGVVTVGPADSVWATGAACVRDVKLVDAIGALGATADFTAEPAAGWAASAAMAAAGGLAWLAVAVLVVVAPTLPAALALPAAGAGVEGAATPAAGRAPVAPVSPEISETSSCSAELASFAVESTSAPTSAGMALSVALLLGSGARPALAACGEVTTGRVKPAAAPDGATADVDVGGVAAAGVTGVGGPSTAIRAANASLKPSPLRPAAGALAGSLGSAGLAVVT